MSAWDQLQGGMGLSSRAIESGGRDYPHDPADLVRCAKYCERANLSTDRLKERMAGRSVEWGRLVEHWDELVALLKDEVENRTDGLAPRTYIEMKRVIADGVACRACDSTGRGTPCFKCKGTGRRSGGRCRAKNCFRGAEPCGSCWGHGYIKREEAAS